LKAIDLYSGIGGWALGLKLAGIEVVESYEWWSDAVLTHTKNLGSNCHQLDIRKLSHSDLPKGIDIVVGSPPCTQFSFSNRGGSGDIKDGLRDVYKFFEVVEYLNPKYWAMENVPRVAGILRSEAEKGRALYRFRHILKNAAVEVFDLSDFGTPQKRKRCIAGNFDLELLVNYKQVSKTVTLGEVVTSLSKKRIVDPIYKVQKASQNISGLSNEEPLSSEELRMNREAKEYHPIYNNMKFPDPFSSPARTITATCTRVSRESVVIEDINEPNVYRRLNVRERSSLQGFPITYQFFGSSYSAQLKMIGNAIPPTFTYLIAKVFLATPVEETVPLKKVKPKMLAESNLAFDYEPDTKGKAFRQNRSFKFAIHNLRFKSGTRFELNNTKGKGYWKVEFFYGDSKNIKSIELKEPLLSNVLKLGNSKFQKQCRTILKELEKDSLSVDHSALQLAWTAKPSSSEHPFRILDTLGDAALRSIEKFTEDDDFDPIIEAIFNKNGIRSQPYISKLKRYGKEIICGIILSSTFNKLNQIDG
jgi:DNA (cytosine-5)-methyltransferase 1